MFCFFRHITLQVDHEPVEESLLKKAKTKDRVERQ